jgi:hypothetical protein
MAESGDNCTNLSTRSDLVRQAKSGEEGVGHFGGAGDNRRRGCVRRHLRFGLGHPLGRWQLGNPQGLRCPNARARRTRVREGIRVTEVIPGSPADRAGVEVQDVVTNVNGEAIEDVDDFADALKHARPGETLLLCP